MGSRWFPAVTDRDRVALATMLDLGVDLVAQSFVRDAEDVDELREAMGERAVPIVAKIETKPAVEQIGRFLEVADGLMVARGDLASSCRWRRYLFCCRVILRVGRQAGRPCIVATQMLESMNRAPRPTRAEASDVANAVLDGADADHAVGRDRDRGVSVRGGVRGDPDRAHRGTPRSGVPRS